MAVYRFEDVSYIRPMIYIRHKMSRDPALNLAMEEYCFRHFGPGEDYALFYVNSPSVIVGRHQDAVAEVDQTFARKHDISVLRRLSGGGAVFHDTGNLNYSFITDFDEDKLAKMKVVVRPILDTLHHLGIPVKPTPKNDLFVGGKKISGAAQFTNTRRLLSHGTLLVEANLDLLRRALSPDHASVFPRAVRSIASPVANLSDFINPPLDVWKLEEALLQRYRSSVDDWGEVSLSPQDWLEIDALAEKKYRSDSWIFGFPK